MYSIVCTSANPNFPAGYLVQHSIPSNIPNLLPCDGRTLSKDQYPELYKAIGLTYGAGNGTFRLPDLYHNVIPKLVYQDFWETWPCRNCGHTFSDNHDRNTWWCQLGKPDILNRGYDPMTNLEYLEMKEKEKPCTDVENTVI